MPERHSEEYVSALEDENKQLRVAAKKASRELVIAKEVIERNRINQLARQSLNAIVEAEKSRLEQYMNLLLGNCPDIILLFTSEGRLAYCTESYLLSTGVAGWGLVKDAPYTDLLPGIVSDSLLTRMKAVFEGTDERVYDTLEVVDFGKHGVSRDFSVLLTPMFHAEGKAGGAMLLFHDSTEMMLAKEDAERASEAKTNFLAMVSHEIRTPMNAIIGLSNILGNSDLAGKQREHLEGIRKASVALLRLINDILDFTKIDAGKLEILPEYFPLAELLDRLKSMFSLMFSQKNLNFTCEYAPDLPLIVFGDDKRIDQVITNLLNNALKYTQEGSVVLRVYRGEGTEIVFAVSDTGIGIHKDDLPRLFGAFERLEQMRNKQVGGTGLGLAITRRLAEMMGGEVHVESEYNKGSTFSVRIPLEPGTEADLPIQASQLMDFITENARALVVDDIEINLQVAAYLLESYGIEVDTALGGALAIELCLANEYDLILMDHMMPEMDGIETALAIRQLEGWPKDVPIVALTANAVTGAADLFFANGFTGFLSKPVDDVALAKGLVTWLPKEKVIIGGEPS